MKTSLLLALALAGSACNPPRQELGPRSVTSAPPPLASARLTPNQELDELDQRRPVPLLPVMAQHQKQNMREHLEAVQGVVAALAIGDFDRVGAAAKPMGFSETMGRMCEHMGAGAPGFTEQALAFHHTADEIVTAAAQHDSPAVLAALTKTLQACTACHATYRQQLVARMAEGH